MVRKLWVLICGLGRRKGHNMKSLPKQEVEENIERIYRIRKANPVMMYGEIGEMVGMDGDHVYKILKQRALRKAKRKGA